MGLFGEDNLVKILDIESGAGVHIHVPVYQDDDGRGSMVDQLFCSEGLTKLGRFE